MMPLHAEKEAEICRRIGGPEGQAPFYLTSRTLGSKLYWAVLVMVSNDERCSERGVEVSNSGIFSDRLAAWCIARNMKQTFERLNPGVAWHIHSVCNLGIDSWPNDWSLGGLLGRTGS